MKSISASSLRFLLFIAICWVALTAAHADNTVPWLTGDFLTRDSGSFFLYNGPQFLIDGNTQFEGSYIGEDFNGYVCEGPDECYSQLGATIISLTMTATHGTFVLQFEGTASGTVSGYSECCQSINSEEDDFLEFSGIWSNGWATHGYYGSYMFTQNGYPYNGGFLSIVTYAPEPSSIVLFGSGILAFADVLRRKILS